MAGDSESLPTAHPYEALTPAVVLEAVETTGVECDGRLLALNSYENRVYQVGIEGGAPIIAKFYRPERWSDAAIREEHAFTRELAEHELPVVAPLGGPEDSLFYYGGFRVALYPRRGGHPPELDRPDNLHWLGRLIGRIHVVGAARAFEHRPALTIEAFGEQSVHYLLEHGFIPDDLQSVYQSVADDVLTHVRAAFERAGPFHSLRLHGDCHPSNILWTDAGPHFVDFDDARTGPAVQDLWMLLSGDRAEMTGQLSELLDGYREFCDFDARELNLVEALRSLRLLNYSAWLARRWDDPAFPRAFPWFGEHRYWEEQILGLREQIAALQEPPLEIF